MNIKYNWITVYYEVYYMKKYELPIKINVYLETITRKL